MKPSRKLVHLLLNKPDTLVSVKMNVTRSLLHVTMLTLGGLAWLGVWSSLESPGDSKGGGHPQKQ